MTRPTPMRVIDLEEDKVIIERAEGFKQVLDLLMAPGSEYAESISDDFGDYLKESASWDSIAKDIMLYGGESYLRDYTDATDMAVLNCESIESADGSLRFERIGEGIE